MTKLPFGPWIPGRTCPGNRLGMREWAVEPFEVDGITYRPGDANPYQRGFFSLENDTGCDYANSRSRDLPTEAELVRWMRESMQTTGNEPVSA